MNCNWGGTDLKSLHIYIYVGKTFKNHFFGTHELQYHVTSSRKIHGTKRERERERKRESKREKGRRKSEGKNGKERRKGQKCNNAPLERVSRRKEVLVEVHTQLCHVGTD